MSLLLRQPATKFGRSRTELGQGNGLPIQFPFQPVQLSSGRLAQHVCPKYLLQLIAHVLEELIETHPRILRTSAFRWRPGTRPPKEENRFPVNLFVARWQILPGPWQR